MVAVIKKIPNEDFIRDDCISKVRNGNENAFEEIVKLYQRRIFILAYGILMNREDAMEITQETFLKLFKSMASLRDNAKFEPWLFAIANNLCIDKIRKNKNAKLRNTSLDEVPDAAIAAKSTPENDKYDNDLKRTIKNSIQELPQRQQTIVVMRYFQELKFHEIAENLGLSIGTVKKLHFTALKKLKDQTLKAWSL